VRAHFEILLYSQVFEHLSSFDDLDNPGLGDIAEKVHAALKQVIDDIPGGV
jgi:hypothetical protein